jgi:hypothetical protein
MDDFYNYTKFKTFWWIIYLEYAGFVCENPEFSARRGFSLADYFKTKEGREFKRKLERIAWVE